MKTLRFIAGGRRVAQRIRSRVFPSRFILVYHKVGRVAHDPWGLTVSPENFAGQLDALATFGPCFTISQMAQRMRTGTLPRRAVAITFDDGYADNLYNAMPALSARGMMATLYLTPGVLGRRREFWWDELERLLFETQLLPDALELEIAGGPFRFSLKHPTDEHLATWRAWTAPPGPRAALYLDLWSRLKPLVPEEQARVLDQIGTWARAADRVRPSHAIMTQAEAARLAQAQVFEIGAHTMHHVSLPATDPQEQRREMAQSKAAASDIAGYEVTHFSYPYGDYTSETAALAREAGFETACTTRQTLLHPDCDLFQLPRIQAHDWTGQDLAHEMATFAQ